MGLHRQLILGTAPLLFFLCDKALHIKNTSAEVHLQRHFINHFFRNSPFPAYNPKAII